jgi:hypothetical protein
MPSPDLENAGQGPVQQIHNTGRDSSPVHERFQQEKVSQLKLGRAIQSTGHHLVPRVHGFDKIKTDGCTPQEKERG